MPVYNAICWQCHRTADMVEELVRDGFGDVIRAKTGLVPDAYFLSLIHISSYYPEERAFEEVHSWEKEPVVQQQYAYGDTICLQQLPDREPYLSGRVNGEEMCIRDRHKEVERRGEQMQEDYADIVSKISLLISAGMTVQGAWGRVAGDYRREREQTGRKR